MTYSFLYYNMQKLAFILPLLFSIPLFSQNGPANPLSVRSHGIANASVAFNDINSLFNNQGGLADLESIGILFSGEETFRNPDSDSFGGGFAIPTSSGTFGMNIHYFGIDEIKQQKIGLTYARKLMDKLSVGIQFDMLSTQFLAYEKSNLFTIEIGLQYQFIDDLLIGMHIYNPTKQEINENEFLPTIVRIGATYSKFNKILLHAELEKDFDFPFIFKSGIEVELVNDLWVRIGFQYKPTIFNMGVSYQLKNGLRIELASFYQQDLDLISSSILGSSGFVPSIGLGFDFKKK